MVLKRKRSVEDLASSSPSLSSSSPGSCAFFLSSPNPFAKLKLSDKPTPTDPFATWTRSKMPLNATGGGSDPSGRTKKRLRNGRPNDNVVAENTMKMLFDAQKSINVPGPMNGSSNTTTASQQQYGNTPMQSQNAQAQAPTHQKSTLHSFWTLPSPAPPMQNVSHAPEFEDPQRARCEDCGRDLQGENDGMSMDVDMCMEEGGGVGGQWGACQGCSKRVCGGCSVVGDVRCCLGCANASGEGRWW